MIKKRKGWVDVKEETCKLIEAVKNQEDGAFEQLYNEFYKLAYFFAYKLCRNEADAKDAVQDTFIEIHRSIHTLKENAYFKAWLYKIVHSKCKKIFRKNKHTTIDFEDEPIINAIQEERIEFTPEQLMRFTSDKEVLDSLIAQLPQSQAVIITLFYLEQFSVKEISEILDIPIGTVKSRLSYGRTCLKKALDEYEAAQGTTLTFREFDALVSAVLLKQFYQMFQKPAFLPFTKRIYQAIHTAHTQIALGIVAAALVLGGVGYATARHSQNDQDTTAANKKFIEKHLGNDVIDNAQDAYFTLFSWACCEEMINQKSDAEIRYMQPLYEELKRYGGVYYEQLKKDQWTGAFEKRLLR